MSITSRQTYKKYAGNGLTGLANLGNSCYLNACMQLFSHTYEFNDFLNGDTYKKRLNKVSDSVLLIEWDKLRRMMWSNNCTIAPWGFIKNIKHIADVKDLQLFTGNSQNEVQEFLLFILDSFHNSIRRDVDMEITGNVKDTRDKMAIACYSKMKDMYKNDYSEILDIFYGMHVSEIISSTTNEVLSVTPEPFSLLSLPIPTKNKVNIYDCFDEYCNSEELTGDNAWYNDKKNKYESVTRGISFWRLPNVLILDLKRWSSTGRKIQKLVTLDLTNINLTPYVRGYDKYESIYDLYGVCNHIGGSYGGHYTSYIKNANGKWYEFDDTNVKEISKDRVVSEMSYCFFFRKKK